MINKESITANSDGYEPTRALINRSDDNKEDTLTTDDSKTISLDTKTIGYLLRRAREKAKFSIQEAAEKSYINANHIRYLENNQYDKLPKQLIYVKTHIRSLCRVYRIDPNQVIKLYPSTQLSDTDNNNSLQQIEELSRITPSQLKLMLILFILTAFMVILGVVYSYRIFESPSGPNNKDIKDLLPKETISREILPIPEREILPIPEN